MRHWKRSAWSLCVAAVLGLTAGCSGETVTPLTERPEVKPWMQDGPDWEHSGPLAACQRRADTECGAYESYDLSACDTGSLAAVKEGGVFTTHVLMNAGAGEEGPAYVSSLRLVPDGGVSNLDTVAFPETRLGDSQAYATVKVHRPDGGSSAVALVGCEASADGLTLKGCYEQCRNGQRQSFGTFEAARVARRQGESESSGVQLVSETAVGVGVPVDVFVAKGHAYVVSIPFLRRPGGLSVYDVSDPKAPVLRTTVSFPGDTYWNGVWAKGDALYVGSSSAGMHVFDISNPADPKFLRSLPSDEGGIDVHTLTGEGDRLYAMSTYPTGQTLIFDVTDARSPVLMSRYTLPGADPAAERYPHDSFPFEGRLYINHWRSGFVIADVRDAQAVEVEGQYVYPRASSHTSRVMRQGGRLIAFEGGEDWGAHLRVLDVSVPAEPRLIGEYRLRPGISIHNMELKGTRLYLSHYQDGLRVLDVTVPELPREVAYYNTFQSSHPAAGFSYYEGAIGIRVPGDGYVYVIDTARGLLVFPEV